MKIHIFGEDNQWAISEDDGCLRFHPQYSIHPEKIGKWIWKEAFAEVEKLGGFEKVIKMLRREKNIKDIILAWAVRKKILLGQDSIDDLAKEILGN